VDGVDDASELAGWTQGIRIFNHPIKWSLEEKQGKDSEFAKHSRCFATSGIPTITYLIFTGCAQLKHQFETDDLLDISCDGEPGFADAVE
jgi:hypothetical protein